MAGAAGRAWSERTRDEFIAKLGVVNEEADEAVYWLEFMKGASLDDAARVDELLAEAKELRAIFAASCRTARGITVAGGPTDHKITR